MAGFSWWEDWAIGLNFSTVLYKSKTAQCCSFYFPTVYSICCFRENVWNFVTEWLKTGAEKSKDWTEILKNK